MGQAAEGVCGGAVAERSILLVAAALHPIGSCEEARWYLANCTWSRALDCDEDGILIGGDLSIKWVPTRLERGLVSG